MTEKGMQLSFHKPSSLNAQALVKDSVPFFSHILPFHITGYRGFSSTQT